MQVSVETKAGLERKVRISVPAEQFESRIDSRLREAARSVRLAGFRPGKVPMNEVRRRFGQGVRQEVASELMQASFVEAVTQEKLSPAGAPSLEVVNMGTGADFEYTATFEVLPEIKLAALDQVHVERPQAEVTADDVERAVQSLREQRKDWIAEEARPAETGDRLNIDFEGSIDGEPFEGNEASDFTLFLGVGRMIAGFEEGLVGVQAGSEKTLEIDFPDDYGNENVAGKRAEFRVKVNEVARPELPPLDEELFKAFGVEEGGIEAFREWVRGRLERDLGEAVKAQVKQGVLQALAELHEFQLPEALIASEVQGLRSNLLRQLAMGGGDMDADRFPDEMFRGEAERRVKLGLLIQAVVDQRQLTPEPERVRAMVEALASSYEQPQQVVNWYYNNEDALGQVRSMALEEQVVELVLAHAQVTDVELSYEEVMHRGHEHPEHEHPEEDESARLHDAAGEIEASPPEHNRAGEPDEPPLGEKSDE